MDRSTIAVVEIGGTSIKVGFLENGKISSFSRTYPTKRLRNAPPIPELSTIVREAKREAGLRPTCVVMTIPGFIAADQNTVLQAANIPELNGLPLASLLSVELGVPVALERDTALQLLGESIAGAVKNEHDVLAIYFGTGIGAAYLDASGIFRGGGWALEIGHMPHYHPERWSVPQRVELLASGKTLADLAERGSKQVADLYSENSSGSLESEVDEVIWYQASAIASAVALLSPRIVLLGGGVVEQQGYPREILRKRIIESLPIISSVYQPDIRWAALGWRAAIHGANLVDHFFGELRE